MKIELKHVSYIYNKNTANENKVLKDISLVIDEGEFIAVAGNTGSGKSTLVQLLNVLKQPDSGEILYNGRSISKDRKAIRDIRCKVGLVFQYPEYQLFDETVIKDVSFGPKNMGCSTEESRERSIKALGMVGLDKELYEKSPFDLSGGERRRVAIAGILAMEPEILILDEPTAGLDPAGKEAILSLVRGYQQHNARSVIMVSHNMDEIAEYAGRVIIMSEGKLLIDADPHEVFTHKDLLELAGLSQPQVTQFCSRIGIEGVITIKEAAQSIIQRYIEADV